MHAFFEVIRIPCNVIGAGCALTHLQWTPLNSRVGSPELTTGLKVSPCFWDFGLHFYLASMGLKQSKVSSSN